MYVYTRYVSGGLYIPYIPGMSLVVGEYHATYSTLWLRIEGHY